MRARKASIRCKTGVFEHTSPRNFELWKKYMSPPSRKKLCLTRFRSLAFSQTWDQNRKDSAVGHRSRIRGQSNWLLPAGLMHCCKMCELVSFPPFSFAIKWWSWNQILVWCSWAFFNSSVWFQEEKKPKGSFLRTNLLATTENCCKLWEVAGTLWCSCGTSQSVWILVSFCNNLGRFIPEWATWNESKSFSWVHRTKVPT